MPEGRGGVKSKSPRAEDEVQKAPELLSEMVRDTVIYTHGLAMMMLFAGFFQGLNVRNGWTIFLRDRYKHASPNSAQTEAACAGLLEVQLAGNAWYLGILHEKPFIGDPLRETETENIPRICRLMYLTSFLMLILSCWIRVLLLR